MSDTPRTVDEIVETLVWCGRQLYHYEQPCMKPLSEESFRQYDHAHQMIGRCRRELSEARAELGDAWIAARVEAEVANGWMDAALKAEAECERLRMESERLCSLIDATEINADHFTWRRSPRSSAQAIREEMDAIFGIGESE